MEENFAVVLVAGLAVFGLLFVASQNLSTSSEAPQKVFVEKSFGKTGEGTQDLRTVSFGGFTVGEGRGDIQAYTAERDTVSNKLFGGEKIVIDYNATAPRGGHVSFEVLGKDGRGPLFVKVNGNTVFREKLVITGSPEINISEDVFKPGVNRIVIGADSGLFSSTKYSIEDVRVTVNDRKFHDYEDTFQVYEHEVQNFVSSNLTFTIPVDSSVPSRPLRIYVNDNLVFNRKISRSTQEVEINTQNANLHTGLNTIRFETDGESRYELENVDMSVRYIGTVSPGNANVDFSMNSSALNYANRENTAEYVNFNYQSLLPQERKMIIELNGFQKQHMPTPGLNSISLPEKTLQGQNTLTIRSNGSYQLNQVKVLSKMVAE